MKYEILKYCQGRRLRPQVIGKEGCMWSIMEVIREVKNKRNIIHDSSFPDALESQVSPNLE